MWRIARLALAAGISATGGVTMGSWAMGDVNAFYMAPIDQYGSPAYARRQPVADTFWQRQDGSDATQSLGDRSTAISALPEYRSASGS